MYSCMVKHEKQLLNQIYNIMKILSKNLILFSLLTMGFAACSENEQLAEDSLSKVPVLLTTQLTAVDAGATRAGTSLNNTALTSGDVGVFLSGDYTTKYTYTAGANGALSSTSPAYYPANGNIDIVAVYPASATASASQATAFAVLADQTVDANYEASDLMRGIVTGVNKTSGVQTVALRHKMAKIIVNVTAGAGVSSISSVTLNNIKRQITYTASTDELGVAEQIEGTYVQVGQNNCAAVIPPQTINASTAFLTIVTDAGAAVYQFGSAKELLSGNYYQLNITVNRTATLDTNTIADWDGSGTANIGATTTEGGLTIADDIADQVYTGQVICPEITAVKRTGEDDPLDDELYDVYYANNINAGTATVYAVGKGTEAGKMGKKEFTINKAEATISFGYSIEGFVVESVTTNTVTNGGDGTVTYSSSDTDVATVDENTGEVTGVNAGSVTITATVVDGSNYTYPEKTASYTMPVYNNLRNNPLWWVARYNTAQGGGFVSGHSTQSQYVFNYYDATQLKNNSYHLPSKSELNSIVPNGSVSSEYKPINQLTGTLDEPTSYVEEASNIGGIDVPASTSYFGKKGTIDYYAVRFIGTKYASVWHYKWVDSPCNGLLVESYQISSTKTVDEAKAILATYSNGGNNFTGSYGSNAANLYPTSSIIINESYATGFAQRFFPACGIVWTEENGQAASGNANSVQGSSGAYWALDANNMYSVGFGSSWLNFTSAQSDILRYARSVRMFYNH